MNTLKIDTGEQTFSLNGECEVVFNPSDPAFVRKLYDAFTLMASKQEEYTKKRNEIDTEDTEKLLNFLDEQDTEMRKMIDNVFNTPVCDKVFGKKNIYALSTAGIPLWASLMLAILDECDANITILNKKGSETAQKYIKKYRK